MWPFSRPHRKQATLPGNPFAVASGTAQAAWSGRDFSTFAQEGYQKNSVAFRAINIVAQGVGSFQWYAASDNEGENESPAAKGLEAIMSRPNPQTGGGAFWAAAVRFLLISGNAYVLLAGPSESAPRRRSDSPARRELWLLRPDRVRAMIDSTTGKRVGYEYDPTGTRQYVKTYPVDKATLQCDVLHLRTFNPLDDNFGLAPLEAAAFSVDQHNAGGQWNYNLLKNSARPSGVLNYAGPGTLTQEQRERLKSELALKHAGSAQAGSVMLLEGGLTWQQLGLSPTDMDFIQGKNLSAREIAEVFGVPPMLCGVPGDATYANYEQARLALVEETALPLGREIADELNAWLTPLYSPSLRLKIDEDAIPAIASKKREQWKKTDEVSFLTINEKRAEVGFDPVPGGDVVLVPSTLLPLEAEQEGGEDTEEGEGETPPPNGKPKPPLTPEDAEEEGYGKRPR